ncbi:MAG: TetR family transcriptional regulator [Caulobacteraceae bacterium]|nr:TetR family transcriptional regulator [Caulobacteraceae bacterium]
MTTDVKTDRRTKAPSKKTLSKETIVEAAIALLDAEGEAGLTFRALSARLSTGAGAIYWHVADKDALLTAASNAVMAQALAGTEAETDPRAGIRAVALAVFDAIEAHPWAGAQLFRDPAGSAMVEIIEGVGGRLLALNVPGEALFDAGSALLNYVLGVAGQNAANARGHPAEVDREGFLKAVADRWIERDPARYPFVHKVAARLADHDDRAQFLAGLELILTGVVALAQKR